MGNEESQTVVKESENNLVQILTGHTGGINCLAVSDDGTVIASGSEDMTIRLWSAHEYYVDCIGILEGHTDYVNCVVFDQQFVISGGNDKDIRKWDVATCECIIIFKGHESLINKLLIVDGFLFSNSYDRTCRCWDKHNGKCLNIFSGHKRGVYPLIFISGDKESSLSNYFDTYQASDVLITGSADYTAKLWSVETTKCLRTFADHEGAVTCISVTEKGDIMYTASTDMTIIQWNLSTGMHLKTLKGHEGVIISMTLYKKILFTGSADQTVRSWVPAQAEVAARVFREHKHSVSSLKVFKGHLITTCGDGKIRIYDAKAGTLKAVFAGHAMAVTSAKIIGNRLVSASVDATARIWRYPPFEIEYTISHQVGHAGTGETNKTNGIRNNQQIENDSFV